MKLTTGQPILLTFVKTGTARLSNLNRPYWYVELLRWFGVVFRVELRIQRSEVQRWPRGVEHSIPL